MAIKNFIHKYNVQLICWLMLISLLAMACRFYLERTIFCDIAFHTIYILSHHQIILSHYRFGSAVTQCIPYFSGLLHLPLKIILLNYSVGYIVYYGIIFLLINYGFKNKWLAMVQLGFYVWFASDSFYWMQSELQQGISFLLLYLAMIIYFSEKGKQLWLQLISLFMLPTCLFFHPLMMFPVGFIFIYFFRIEKIIDRRTMLVLSIMTVVTLVIKKIYFTPMYDQQHFGSLRHFITLFPNYFSTPSFKNFTSYCLQDYGVWILFAVVVFYKLWRIGKRRAVLFTIIFSFFYLLLIDITNKDGGDKFYFDNMYSLIGLFLAICIFFSAKEIFILHPKWLAAVFFITIIRLAMIFHTHEIYSERIKWHKEIITYCRQNKITKLAIPYSDSLTKKLIMTWGMAYESLLISSVDNKGTLTYIFGNDAAKEQLINLKNSGDTMATNTIITPFEWIDQNKLAPFYFNLPKEKYVLK